MQQHLSGILSIERAISDMRRGYGIIVTGHGLSVLTFAADTVSETMLSEAYNATHAPCYAVLTEKRLKNLCPGEALPAGAGKVALSWPVDIQALYLMAGLAVPLPHITENVHSVTEEESAALELVKLAELIPAALVLPLAKGDAEKLAAFHLLSVTVEDIFAYKQRGSESLAHVCHAPLCLEGAEDAAIDVYRPALGGSEHYAITIGDCLKDDAPLVRIHSSCYTGDLLRSLKCDCGDQLHEAIHFMGDKAKAGNANDSGGIIIYLMQEGRGIGLTNKLRAYDLQSQGADTVDANEILGFDDDERLFLPAAKILGLLGVKKVRLLTNNPRKAKGLEEYGVKVTACVPHIMKAHQHNDAYLKTKAERLGHEIPSSHYE